MFSRVYINFNFSAVLHTFIIDYYVIKVIVNMKEKKNNIRFRKF